LNDPLGEVNTPNDPFLPAIAEAKHDEAERDILAALESPPHVVDIPKETHEILLNRRFESDRPPRLSSAVEKRVRAYDAFKVVEFGVRLGAFLLAFSLPALIASFFALSTVHR